MLSAKTPMPNETAAGPQNAQNSLNNDWRSEHELMTLQNKTTAVQIARKLTRAKKFTMNLQWTTQNCRKQHERQLIFKKLKETCSSNRTT